MANRKSQVKLTTEQRRGLAKIAKGGRRSQIQMMRIMNLTYEQIGGILGISKQMVAKLIRGYDEA